MGRADCHLILRALTGPLEECGDTGVVVSDFHRLGLVLLAAAVVVAVYGLLLRRLSPWDLAAAALFSFVGGDPADAVAAREALGEKVL